MIVPGKGGIPMTKILLYIAILLLAYLMGCSNMAGGLG